MEEGSQLQEVRQRNDAIDRMTKKILTNLNQISARPALLDPSRYPRSEGFLQQEEQTKRHYRWGGAFLLVGLIFLLVPLFASSSLLNENVEQLLVVTSVSTGLNLSVCLAVTWILIRENNPPLGGLQVQFALFLGFCSIVLVFQMTVLLPSLFACFSDKCKLIIKSTAIAVADHLLNYLSSTIYSAFLSLASIYLCSSCWFPPSLN